jgi:hypothetical protein
MRYKHIFVAITAVMLGFSDAIAGTTLTSKDYVDTAVAGKQPVITGLTNGSAITYGGSAGAYNERAIVTSVGTDTAATTLPTAGAVVKGLNGKQEAIAGGTSGNLVAYSGTAGTVGVQTVYKTNAAYSGQTSALVQAQHVNAATTNAFNAVMTCNAWDPDVPVADRTDENCWLWNVNRLSGTYVPGA